MPYNADLLTALTNQAHAAALSTPEGIDALNALLEAGADADRFRKAIIDKKTFWASLGIAGLNNVANAAVGDATSNLFLDPNENPQNAQNGIPTLLMRATETRVKLGLKNAAEPLLLSVINTNNPTEIRQRLAEADAAGKAALGNVAGIPTWNHSLQTIIDDNAADRIWLEAKQSLLLRKIEATTDTALIANLLNARGANPAYGLAAVALGTPPGKFVYFDNTPEIERAAFRKGLSLYIKTLPSHLVLINGFQVLNQVNPATFKGLFVGSPFAQSLDDRDIPAIKGEFGARFLDLTIASNPQLTKGDLATIAATANPTHLAGFLKTKDAFTNNSIDAGVGAYIDNVPAQTLPILRQTAATTALKKSIDGCDDLPTLEALIAAKTPDDIKEVLANSDSLGFKGNKAFRDAFAATTATADVIKDIVATAHVRQSLVTAEDPDHLKALIDDASFLNHYTQHFAIGATPALNAALATYFNKPENRKKAREEALIDYAKVNLANVNLMADQALDSLVQAGATAAVLTGAKTLLGLGVADHTADDLITAHNSGVGQQLRAYAAAEQLFREKKALDLTNVPSYAELTGAINDVTSNHVAVHQRALLATLPPKDKQALQAGLAEVLANNYQVGVATPLINLTNLVKAENLTDFQSALTALGISDHAWTDDKSRVPVQRAACLTAIKLNISEVSQFDAQAHPALAAVVSNLPLQKQKDLLAKPKILKALVRAQDANEVKRIVGDNSINADPLVAENKQLALIAKIQTGVAKILASVQPPLSLTAQDINNINNEVRAAGFAGGYVAEVNAIAAYTGPNRAGVFQAFGLNNTGTAVVDGGTKRGLIHTQKQYNTQLENLALDPNNNLTVSEQAVLNLVLSLDKVSGFTAPAAPVAAVPRVALAPAEFTTFFDDFQAAGSAEQFIKIAKGVPSPPPKSYYAKLNPASFEKQLTPEAFKEVKRTLSQQKFLDRSSPASYTAALAAQKNRMAAMANILTAIQNKDIAIAYELKSLSKVKAIEWLNPGFQAASMQKAHKMVPHFKKVADGCDALVNQFQHQRDALVEEYKSLPTKIQVRNLPADPYNPTAAEKTQIRAINERREALNEQINEVTATLMSYKGLQKTLKGNPNRQNPLLQKGILKTLEEIKEGKKDIQFLPFNSSIKDYPMAKLDEHLRQGFPGEAAAAIPTQVSPGSATYYKTIDLVKEGEFREHTIPYTGSSGTPIHSRFIEERDHTKNLKGVVGEDGKVSFLPSIKLTASQFPSGGPPTITDEELIDAKVAYSLAMASQILAGLAKAPTADKDNQIVLRGSNPDELKHLWSAFVALGKTDPNMKFDESAVKVISSSFNPKDEKGWLYGYNDNSYYANYYEKNPRVADLTAGIKEVNENKVLNSEPMIEDTKVVSGFFKDELKQTLDAVKQQNEQDDIVPPTLGG